jgi:large subunit ribosomal protein L24
MRIKKNDKVQIISGQDRGKNGKIMQVLLKKNKVVVEGLNLRVKHVRPRRQGEKGQRIQFPAPLAISNVALLCPKCGRRAKIGYKILENQRKVRICKKCQEVID